MQPGSLTFAPEVTIDPYMGSCYSSASAHALYVPSSELPRECLPAQPAKKRQLLLRPLQRVLSGRVRPIPPPGQSVAVSAYRVTFVESISVTHLSDSDSDSLATAHMEPQKGSLLRAPLHYPAGQLRAPSVLARSSRPLPGASERQSCHLAKSVGNVSRAWEASGTGEPPDLANATSCGNLPRSGPQGKPAKATRRPSPRRSGPGDSSTFVVRRKSSSSSNISSPETGSKPANPTESARVAPGGPVVARTGQIRPQVAHIVALASRAPVGDPNHSGLPSLPPSSKCQQQRRRLNFLFGSNPPSGAYGAVGKPPAAEYRAVACPRAKALNGE